MLHNMIRTLLKFVEQVKSSQQKYKIQVKKVELLEKG